MEREDGREEGREEGKRKEKRVVESKRIRDPHFRFFIKKYALFGDIRHFKSVEID